jgi:hypothetical protein
MKKELLKKAADNYQAFSSAAFKLSRQELETPGLIESRAFKDVIAHIAFWQLMAITGVIEAKAGIRRKTDYTNDKIIDALNAQAIVAFKDFPLANLFGLLASTQRSVVAVAEALTEEELALGGKAREWFSAETFEHYDEHLPPLKKYLAQKGK